MPPGFLQEPAEGPDHECGQVRSRRELVPSRVSGKWGVERSTETRLASVQGRLWREEARNGTYRPSAGPKPSWKTGRKI